jgi:hypothetical protein
MLLSSPIRRCAIVTENVLRPACDIYDDGEEVVTRRSREDNMAFDQASADNATSAVVMHDIVCPLLAQCACRTEKCTFVPSAARSQGEAAAASWNKSGKQTSVTD